MNGGHAAQHVALVLAKGQEQKHRRQKMEVMHAKDQQLKRKTAIKVHAQVRNSFILPIGKKCRKLNSYCQWFLLDYRFAVDCEWGTWGEWGSCSATCGTATRERTRAEAQQAIEGGASCTGLATDTEDCIQSACQGKGISLNLPPG